VVESGPDGENLAAGAWQRLEALPGPRSPRGRVYPLACLVPVTVCAFTAAGNDWFTAVGQWVRRAGQADLARLRAPWDRSPAGTGHRMRRRSGSCWTASTRGRWRGPGPRGGRGPGWPPAASVRGYRAQQTARQAKALARGR
jgi:hypothetical protein